MSYATATELLIRFDFDEISQRADRMVPRLVTDEMLRIAAAGGDLSGFTPEERAAIARAMEKVDRALADARYYLYDDQFTETVKQRYDANIKFLIGVASGDVKLGVDAESGVEPAGGAGAELYTAGRIWDRRSSGGFL